MSKLSYGQAFDTAANELEQALAEKAALDTRITERRDAVVALSNLLGQGDPKRRNRFDRLIAALPVATLNLSEAVRDVVYGAKKGLTPTEVRDAIVKRTPEFRETVSLLASVHSTLKRLAKQGEINCQTGDGNALYSWAGPKWGARNSLANALDRSTDKTPSLPLLIQRSRKLK
jgi:hypothetical protein